MGYCQDVVMWIEEFVAAICARRVLLVTVRAVA